MRLSVADISGETWRAFALAGLAGAAGGALFEWAHVPLGWLLGSLVATTLAAVARVPVAVPAPLRGLMVAVLGVMVGSAFTPDVVADMDGWIATLLVLFAYVIASGALSQWFFHKVGGFDPVTSYFAAAPGGLNEMVWIGAASGGDEKTIALAHAVRILVVVLTVPVALRFWGGVERVTNFGPPGAVLELDDVALLTLAAGVGYAAARALRLPAAPLLGPMAASALVHVAGWTGAEPPTALVALAQVVVGTALGSRFAGVDLGVVWRALLIGAASTVLLIVTAIMFAAGALVLFDEPFPRMMLALSPGGVAEMSLTALALHIDTAFVSSHHVARIAMVVTIAPVIFRLWWRNGDGDGPPS